MTGNAADRRLRKLTTPRSAGWAGVLFALLFGTALILIRTSLPDAASRAWDDGANDRLRTAVILMPFAGVTFLWFVGVVRDGIGRLEDRFFSSILFGSGILFLAMIFAATAVGSALSSVKDAGGDDVDPTDTVVFGQHLFTALSSTYALRMAAVFMMSLATIWLRTRLVPTWLVVVTYLVAVTVLVAVDVSMWLTLAFPAWVLVVSGELLGRADVRPAAAPTPDTV